MINTERLLLAPVTMEDLPFITQLFSHNEVRKFYVLHPDHARDLSLFVSYMVKAVETGQSLQFIVYLNNGTPIGLVGGEIRHMRDGSVALDVAYAVSPRYQNMGYATEAVLGFTGFIRQFNIPMAYLDISENNSASIRVAQKTGYKQNRNTAHFDSNHPELDFLFHWEMPLHSARDQYFLKGVQAFRNDNFAMAAEMFSRAVQETYTPGSPNTDALCYSNMGVACSHAGRYYDAYTNLKKAQQLGLNNPTIQKELLWLKTNKGIG